MSMEQVLICKKKLHFYKYYKKMKNKFIFLTKKISQLFYKIQKNLNKNIFFKIVSVSAASLLLKKDGPNAYASMASHIKNISSKIQKDPAKILVKKF